MPASVRDNLRGEMHLEAEVSLNEDCCFLREARSSWTIDDRLHVVILNIDNVESVPAVAYDEGELGLVETRDGPHPVLVRIGVIGLFQSFDNLPIIDDQQVPLTDMD